MVFTMKIDPYLRKELVKELQYCAKKILEEGDVEKKMYFYRYVWEALDRIIDLSFDPQLLFAQFVIEVSHGTISNRVNQIRVKKDKTIPLVEGVFDLLTKSINELATKIEKDEDIYKTLEQIVKLTYLNTSDGHYQFTKGMIEV